MQCVVVEPSFSELSRVGGAFISSIERTVVGNDLGAVLGAVRELAEGPIAAEAARVDRDHAFPAENLKALAGVGAFGLVIPAEHGGTGGALVALAEACEAVGTACASSGMEKISIPRSAK